MWLHPATTELIIIPTLLKTKDGRVDLVTDGHALEVLAEVDETHPASSTRRASIIACDNHSPQCFLGTVRAT